MTIGGLIIQLGFSPIVFALKITDQSETYILDPESLETLQETMIQSSTIQSDNPYHKPTGAYIATISFDRFKTKFKDNKCRVSDFEFKLDGKTITPKLKEGKRYLTKLKLQFEAELYMIKHHENKHKLIWQSVLEDAEKKIRSLRTEDDESCSSLSELVNQHYQNALLEANRKNSVFDCVTYGNRLNPEQQCEN